MAEFVMLPIIDENGFQTKRNLLVDTRHFLGAAGSETAHNYIKVVENDEIEVLDRIIHGLAPRVTYKKQKVTDDLIEDPVSAIHTSIERWQDDIVKDVRLHNVAVIKADGGPGYIQLVDESLEVETVKPDWWRTIPGFSRYDMSSYKAVAEKDTGKSVSIVKGISNKRRLDNVLLTNDDGIVKRMSVAYLFEQTFPELA